MREATISLALAVWVGGLLGAVASAECAGRAPTAAHADAGAGGQEGRLTIRDGKGYFLDELTGDVATEEPSEDILLQARQNRRNRFVEILRPRCEMELALSAAPEHLRAGAGLLVLRADGYARARESSNGFECIVNRDHPRALKPTCFDAGGTKAIVPKILQIGLWLLQGVKVDEIDRRVQYALASGAFQRAARPGVAYMLSNFNRPWNPNSESLGWFPPHVMFYAPNLTNEDIGYDPDSYSPHRRLPLVAYQGPHGYIIMVTGETRPKVKSELKACPPWVWE